MQPDAELGGLADLGHHLGGGDQGLRRDRPGEHRRPAEALVLDERDGAAELAGDERRLVAARSAADDHHPVHAPIVSGSRATPAPAAASERRRRARFG